MKRNIIFRVSLFLVLGGCLLAKGNTVLKVKVQTANVRSGPDAASPVIAKVASGTLLEASGREGAWYEVTVSDKEGKEVTGYIHNSVVSVVNGKEEEATEEEAEEEEEARPAPAPRRQAPSYRAAKEYAAGGVKLMGGLSMGNLNVSEEIPATVKKTSKMGFMGGLGYESGGQIAFEMDLLYSPGGAVFKPSDPALKANIVRAAHLQRRMVVEDLELRPPTIVFAERSRSRLGTNGRPFDDLAFYLEDPQFSRIWSAYEEYPPIGPLRVFVRRGESAQPH